MSDQRITLTFDLYSTAGGELNQMARFLAAIEQFATKLAEDKIANLAGYDIPALNYDEEADGKGGDNGDTLKLSPAVLERLRERQTPVARPVTEVCVCEACGRPYSQSDDMVLHNGSGYHRQCLWMMMREGGSE